MVALKKEGKPGVSALIRQMIIDQINRVKEATHD